jgi:cyclophilin family peptidyl-prolyl cis-trans isomerase
LASTVKGDASALSDAEATALRFDTSAEAAITIGESADLSAFASIGLGNNPLTIEAVAAAEGTALATGGSEVTGILGYYDSTSGGFTQINGGTDVAIEVGASSNLNLEAFAVDGTAEALLVGPFPYAIPSEFDALPRLLGRATVLLRTTKGDLTAVVDGYNAPLTAGAFVDLVKRGFYDNLPFVRAEDFYVLQTGDPKGDADGYVDPKTKSVRRVPLEIRVPGKGGPFYNETFEDLGLFKAEPILPFNAKGTLGWAHSDDALDDGSSQFFLFLSEPELTPAGLNLIDGRYAAFGYVVEGLDVLNELTAEDGIVSAKLLEGAENLQEHA